MFDRLWLRIGYIVTVTRLLVASLFDKALHEFVVPWSLSYLLSWRGGSTGNNPSLIFYHRNSLLSFDRRSQNNVSFTLKALPGVSHRVYWRLLTAHRNSGACQRWELSIASRIGSKIVFTHYHWTATSSLPIQRCSMVEKD